MQRTLSALALLLSASLLHADSLDAVLARMDKAAPTIHDMTADVKMITYTAVLDDKSTESGTLQMQKLGPSDVRAIISFTGGQDNRTVALLGKYAEIYYPNVNGYQRVDLGNNAAQANQLMLLGFGSSGADLSKAYDIQAVGSEQVNGQDTTKLQLVPKDQSLKQKLAKVFLWIPANEGYPVQQQFFDPGSGNYRLVAYSNINLQAHFPKTLDFKLPKGAKLIEK